MNENETNKLIENLKQRRDEALRLNGLWTCSAEELRAALDAGIRDFRRAGLAGANLTGASLAGAWLAGANLADARLADANLVGASLAQAWLAGANLAGARLVNANLTGASLAGANLVNANLAGASLYGANLADASLYGARLAGARLHGADLMFAEGIMATYLPGMSSRGDYLYLVHQNQAPARFLAGCQWLTRDELVAQVKEKKDADSPEHDLYLLAIDFLAAAAQRLGWQI